MSQVLQKSVDQHIREGDRVLDFGCGEMPYRALIENRRATYVGADFDDHADVRIAPSGSVDVADGSMDVVLSVQVLEHVRDIEQYFSEISRVLTPQGKLLLSTHGTWLYHPHPEDHRRWTRTGLIHDIEKHGFRVREVDSIVGPLGTTTMIRLTGFVFFLRGLPLIGNLLGGALALVMNTRGWFEELITPEQIRAENGCVYVTCSDRVRA